MIASSDPMPEQRAVLAHTLRQPSGQLAGFLEADPAFDLPDIPTGIGGSAPMD